MPCIPMLPSWHGAPPWRESCSLVSPPSHTSSWPVSVSSTAQEPPNLNYHISDHLPPPSSTPRPRSRASAGARSLKPLKKTTQASTGGALHSTGTPQPQLPPPRQRPRGDATDRLALSLVRGATLARPDHTASSLAPCAPDSTPPLRRHSVSPGTHVLPTLVGCFQPPKLQPSPVQRRRSPRVRRASAGLRPRISPGCSPSSSPAGPCSLHLHPSVSRGLSKPRAAPWENVVLTTLSRGAARGLTGTPSSALGERGFHHALSRRCSGSRRGFTTFSRGATPDRA